jgi:hypothetical protein
MTVRIMSDEVDKSLHGNDGARDRVIFRNHLLEKDLQGIPVAAVEIMDDLSSAEDFY